MLLDIMKTRRSIRVYKDQEVEQEKVDIILKSALLAPTGRATRAWEFIVVNDKDKIKKLSRCRNGAARFLEGAPLAIVVSIDEEKASTWVEDASISAVYIQLAAHSLGLGSCWAHVRERSYSKTQSSESYVKEVLGVPEKIRILCIIGIGYPGEEKPPHKEEDLLYEKIHYNQF